MPKRGDIKSIMVLGSGPIIIGQACEFDYSGTQGCKALKEEGCRVILLNSNPATVMTDPGFSDRTYMEPLNLSMASAIIRLERPDALLPTLGGQTALNLAMELHKAGVLEECGVRMIGARPESIEVAENRQAFRRTMTDCGLDLPRSESALSVAEAVELARGLGFPVIVRPSYTLGGKGGGVAYDMGELKEIARLGIEASPIGQILVEESVLGWKEIELEVMRDRADNAIVVCGIENLDPMGVHTGDSITVAPIQTLADVEYQALRDDALAVVRAVGVDTGGCNIQFAVDPVSGRRVVIEMNPRVSRSSALASKATGFPIARVAAKLALGYRLDELRNDITGTSACFEPTMDYCVVKAPRFNFEKFAGSDPSLGLQMHSVGETMSLGGNFCEALQKALRGLETGLAGLEPPRRPVGLRPSPAGCLGKLRLDLRRTGPERLLLVYEALLLGMPVTEVRALTGIDPWFLAQILRIVEAEKDLPAGFAPLAVKALAVPKGGELPEEFRPALRRYKRLGFSDARLAELVAEALPASGANEEQLRALRLRAGLRPAFRCVDTCAGEFAARTPYFYSTYDSETSDALHAAATAKNGGCETRDAAQAASKGEGKAVPDATGATAQKGGKKAAGRPGRVIILGGGPNRIGQGVEFDYCCVQAAGALRELGVTAIMVNSNPETVSTDFDTADRLYFEPVTAEDVLAVCEAENPDGVVVQFGGQTPLNIAAALEAAGVPILGTKPAGIALAEDREAFAGLAEGLEVPQPAGGMARNQETACNLARRIGYPVMVRPSFVLGGRDMRRIHGEGELRAYIGERRIDPDMPILIDKFLEDAIEVDVDAVLDGREVTVAAIMEHIEQAGIHSGDSSCSIPTHTLEPEVLERIRDMTRSLGLGLGVVGLMNVQFAVTRNPAGRREVYVLEANPRASRTVPFVSKATGRNVAGIAAKVMAGLSLAETGFIEEPRPRHHAVKAAVIPFERFPGTVIHLGPEMRSTGEVMGIDRSFGMAILKAQSAAGAPIPYEGNVVLSVSDQDKEALAPLAARLAALGFGLYATPGTLAVLAEHGIAAELVVKIGPRRPHLLDFMRNGEAGMIVNTVSGPASARDATVIRETALARGITLITTIAALRAAVEGLEIRRTEKRSVAPLQDYYAGVVEGKPLK